MIEIIYGPMFAGKTRVLIGRMGDCSIGILPACDTRSRGDELVARDGTRRNAIKTGNLVALVPHLTESIIAIDEAHMFDRYDLREGVKLLDNANKIVIVAGLFTNHEQVVFPWVNDLDPDVRIQMRAKCGCGNHADHTWRKTPLKGTLVGDTEDYEAICMSCLIQKKEKK